MTRVYVCSCFGITEQQVKQHAGDGRCTPRQIASACKAGTDCGSCVKRIQSLLGRGAGCSRESGGGTERLAAMLEAVGPKAVVTETVTAHSASVAEESAPGAAVAPAARPQAVKAA